MAASADISAADLSFLARVNDAISRFDRALDYLTQLVHFKPSLSRSERDTFCLIVKDTVDPIRATLRRLTATITAAPTSEHKAALEGIRAKSLSRLDAVCGDAVALINGTLLPNASETAALVFFQKMLGDLHRYSCEFADRPDVKDLALQAYTEGLRAAEGVADADPVKLGLVLNFAVFCREHLGDESRAVDLVTDALQRVEDRVDALSEESTKASLAVIEQMQENLLCWQPEEYNGDDEEEPEQ